MKMMDCVEVMVEKDSYAKEGVHKGMQGVVWEKEPKDGCWVVLFPQCGDKEDIADLYMKEEDLKLIPVMSPDVGVPGIHNVIRIHVLPMFLPQTLAEHF